MQQHHNMVLLHYHDTFILSETNQLPYLFFISWEHILFISANRGFWKHLVQQNQEKRLNLSAKVIVRYFTFVHLGRSHWDCFVFFSCAWDSKNSGYLCLETHTEHEYAMGKPNVKLQSRQTICQQALSTFWQIPLQSIFNSGNVCYGRLANTSAPNRFILAPLNFHSAD